MSGERNVAEGSTRPAVDLAGTRTQAVLALVLGLLSVPGSTLAWDLPKGGLWIGLPLGIAAIVIGLRARREMAGAKGSWMATAGAVIGALAIAQMAVYYIVASLT